MTIVNTLIVNWADGYIELADSASVTTYGRREGLLDAGSIYDVDALVRLADQNLAITKEPATSIVAAMDDVDAASGYSPYVAFGLGDSVTVPAIGGGTQSVRCVGITVNEDGDGYLDVATEFSTVRDLTEERVQRWLTRTANGTLDGRSPTPVTSASSPSIFESAVVSASTFNMSTDGAYAPEVGDSSAGRTPPAVGFLYRLTISATAGGTGTTTVRLNRNGAPMASISLPANQINATYDLTITQVAKVALSDIFDFEVTASGGAEGINVEAFISPVGV